MSGELTTSLPKGGTPGQVLTKVSYDNYKVDWKDPPGGSGGVEEPVADGFYQQAVSSFGVVLKILYLMDLHCVTGRMERRI